MNDVIVSVSAMKITPIRPPRLSPWAEALSRKFGRRISKSPSRLSPNATKRPATARFSHGLFARFWSDDGREEEREEHADRREDADDRQAVDDRQAGRSCPCLRLLPLLDEEVDRDRHHRPDAGHHQREQPAQGRGEQERDQPSWAFWAISLTGAAEVQAVAADCCQGVVVSEVRGRSWSLSRMWTRRSWRRLRQSDEEPTDAATALAC